MGPSDDVSGDHSTVSGRRRWQQPAPVHCIPDCKRRLRIEVAVGQAMPWMTAVTVMRGGNGAKPIAHVRVGIGGEGAGAGAGAEGAPPPQAGSRADISVASRKRRRVSGGMLSGCISRVAVESSSAGVATARPA